MNIQQKIIGIKELVLPLLDEKQIELIDIELKGNVGNLLLRIYVDCDGGISLGKCTAISRDVSDILDKNDVIPGKYRLDVSSPGLDRPLKTVRDFQRNIDRYVIIARTEGPDVTGIIISANEQQIILSEAKDEITIPFDTIRYGKIKLKW
jgi:ribosome maturation factor RimP